MSRKLLEACIRALVSEAAVAPSAAASNGLALCIQGYQNSVRYTLYSPSAFQEFLQTNDYLPDSYDEVPNGIFAYFQTTGGPADSCAGASEVSVSSAQKGYGPMMYDVCMSHLYPTPIMPDRTNVTGAAANVWKYYLKRNDVQKVPLSDNDCKLHDDADVNYAFKGKPANYSALVANHENFMKQIGQNSQPFLRNIQNIGTQFFDQLY